LDNYTIDAFHLIKASLAALPNFRDMDDFFSAMAKTNFIMVKFDEQRSYMDNIHNNDNIQFDLISFLITNGF
jgi:hypothetical protein